MGETHEKEMQRKKFSFGLYEFDISLGFVDGDIKYEALEPRGKVRASSTGLDTTHSFCFLNSVASPIGHNIIKNHQKLSQ